MDDTATTEARLISKTSRQVMTALNQMNTDAMLRSTVVSVCTRAAARKFTDEVRCRAAGVARDNSPQARTVRAVAGSSRRSRARLMA